MSHMYEQVPGDPAIRVCVTHNPEFGLYGDEECHAGDPGYAAHAWRDIAGLLAARLETHMPFADGEEGEEDAAALRVYEAASRLAGQEGS